MAGYQLGIDYGTSNTVAMLRRADGRVRPLLFDGSPLLPSAVCADEQGSLVTGRDAVNRAKLTPASFEPNVKRRIDELEMLLGSRSYPVVDLIAATLRRVASEAASVTDASPEAVAITCPASWGPARRAALQEAARAAGLTSPTLVPEPVAAANYFATTLGAHLPARGCLVVYDLGAGTFDVSVVRRTASEFETLSYRGLDDFGGLDLDATVVQRVGELLTTTAPEAWERLSSPRSQADRRHFRLLWDDAREVKESLSRQASAGLYVIPADTDVMVTRDEFESDVRPRLAETVRVTEACIREARIARSDVRAVFLVGGGSRVPLIATLLHRALNIAPTITDQPEIVVAEGALLSPETATVPPRRPRAPQAPPVPRPRPTPSEPRPTPGEPRSAKTTVGRAAVKVAPSRVGPANGRPAAPMPPTPSAPPPASTPPTPRERTSSPEPDTVEFVAPTPAAAERISAAKVAPAPTEPAPTASEPVTAKPVSPAPAITESATAEPETAEPVSPAPASPASVALSPVSPAKVPSSATDRSAVTISSRPFRPMAVGVVLTLLAFPPLVAATAVTDQTFGSATELSVTLLAAFALLTLPGSLLLSAGITSIGNALRRLRLRVDGTAITLQSGNPIISRAVRVAGPVLGALALAGTASVLVDRVYYVAGDDTYLEVSPGLLVAHLVCAAAVGIVGAWRLERLLRARAGWLRDKAAVQPGSAPYAEYVFPWADLDGVTLRRSAIRRRQSLVVDVSATAAPIRRPAEARRYRRHPNRYVVCDLTSSAMPLARVSAALRRHTPAVAAVLAPGPQPQAD